MPEDGKRRVLVVEDDEAMRETLSEVLLDGGFAVDVASNGQEALDRLRSGEVRPAVILLDLMMPIMDGWQFCERRATDPAILGIPVIIMSASAHKPPPGVADFVKKPFELDALLATVGRHAASS